MRDIGFRLGWDDEQILTWHARQLIPEPPVPPATNGERIDAPLGAFAYRIDVQVDGDPTWHALTHVRSTAPLELDGIQLLPGGGVWEGELAVEVHPQQFDGVQPAIDLWLPAYLAQWDGGSVVLADELAAALYRTEDAIAGQLGRVYEPVGLPSPSLRYGRDYRFRCAWSTPPAAARSWATRPSATSRRAIEPTASCATSSPSRRGSPTSRSHVAVGDLITGPAQEALREAGWGWLDRRGHLFLRGKGIHIDADVSPDHRATAAPHKLISGVAAISWAAALLLSPDDPPSMREIARRVSISHSAIVTASKRLRAASLIRADGRPLVPELFWALAEEWHPRPVALAQEPPVGDAGAYRALGVNIDEDGPGWALAGTVGAVTWGAPMAIGSAYPPDFYVPSPTMLRQATRLLGHAPRFEDRACTVAVAPTPLVGTKRHDRNSGEWGHWRFAHGLFAALDLAQDRARGTEVLADWNPKDFTRVW